MAAVEGWIDWNSSFRRRPRRHLDSGYGFRIENPCSAYRRRHRRGLYHSKVNARLAIAVSKGHRALQGFRFVSVQQCPCPCRSIRRTAERSSMHRLAPRVR